MFKQAVSVSARPMSPSYRNGMRFAVEDLAKSLETVDDPAFAVDGEGKIIAWNSGAEAALGHSRGCVIGRPCHTVICGRDAFGNPVCQRDCLVLQSLRESKPVRRFRMGARTSTGHHVDTECATLQLWVSSEEAGVIHLLRLWPGRFRDAAPHNGRGDLPALQPELRPLTPRESEVLGLLVEGKSTREMVKALGVSPATVRTHIENMLRKLGVHSRLEAVAVALREDLIGTTGCR